MGKQKNTFLGIDLGGTKLLLGEIDDTGRLLQSRRYKTGFTEQQQAVDILMEALDDYAANVGFKGTPVAVGAGIVGVIDHTNGIWLAMDHLRSTPVPLAQMLSARLGIPAAIDNDVRCATTAELILGYGRETKNFIYMNVGTGIAAGFVSEGRIIRGQNNNSGEIGHMVVDYDSTVPCICGRNGCIEAIASGSGFTGRVKTLAPQYATKLAIPENGEGVDAAEIFRLADEGDELCLRLAREAADALACGIMNLVRTSDPEAVILGGGVISDGWMLEKVLERLDKTSAMRGVRRGVMLSGFDPEYTGLIGAGAIAIAHVNSAASLS